MNTKLDQMRADIETEIKDVDETLGVLRAQRDALAAKIRDKVAEQTELRSALARLTPRHRKSTPTATPEVAQA